MLEGIAVTIGALVAAAFGYLLGHSARSHGAPWKDASLYAVVALLIGASVGGCVYFVATALAVLMGA